MRFSLTFLVVFLYFNSFSCYNEFYALDSKGNFHPIEMGAIRFDKNFDLHRIEKKLAQIAGKLAVKADYKLLSDYALYLVKGGKVKEALVIFEALAKAYPNEYSIIANLGTTYELSGNNEKALEYIRKGLKLNPNSHGGSEWIHVRLLQAKIGLAKDANYFRENNVLNLTSKQETSEKVRQQLYIQLQERFPFCKGPDPIMADLFIDLGDCYAETISFEHAKALYQIAKFYYNSDRPDIDEKIGRVKKLREKYADREPETDPEKIKMGMSEKVDGISYTYCIHDQNADNYQINWSGIETNPDKLLAMTGLERIKEEQPEPKTLEKIVKKDPVVTNTVKKPNNSMLWIGLTIAVLIIALFTYFKSKRK